jgi:predicted PurR-regulated permease PerM
LIAVAFSFPVNLFSRWISRGWAALLTLILFFAALVGIVTLAVPIVSRQANQLISQAPKAYVMIEHWLSRVESRGALSQLPEGQNLGESATAQLHGMVAKILPQTLPVALNTASILSGAFLLVIMAAFLVHEPRSYREGLKYLVPREREPEFYEAWDRLGRGLRHWVGGIMVSMSIMGTLCALGLWIAGIDGWFTLGLITLFGTFIPYAGAIMSSVPGLVIGLSQSVTHFFYALIVYLCVHIVEGYIVQPFVMKRAVSLRPGLLLFWQALMTGFFGILGIIVATPLLVCVEVLVGYFYIERHLGKEGPKP